LQLLPTGFHRFLINNDSFPILGALPFRAKESKPEALPSSIGLDSQGNVHGLLSRSPLANGEEDPLQKQCVAPLAQGPFLPGFRFFRSNLEEREMLWGGQKPQTPSMNAESFRMRTPTA